MKKTILGIILFMMYSCEEKPYEEINASEFNKFTIQETLISNNKYAVLQVGTSVSDEYPQLAVKYVPTDDIYLFGHDCYIENDSTIIAYYHAFIIDEEGEFRKDGIWVYADFFREGIFPFQSRGINFAVDSIPHNWDKPLPRKEGIYFYKNNTLVLHSNEQSEEKFKEKEIDGFYFIPNEGRLFERINLNQL